MVGIPDPIRPGQPLPLRLSVSLAALRRAAAMAAVLFSLSACWGLSGESRSPGGEQVLQSNLSVASAALAAGQPAIAQKLYLALAERFDDAPEPVLGLGYIALQTESPGEAGDYFRRAAKLAVDAPGLRAEALLGAARASLAQGDSGTARHHLSAARDLAEASSTIAWIENGLAVAAVFEEDYRTAEAHYASALRQPAAHPRIAANFVRMLVASERIDEAERTYGAYAASYWEEGDRQTLQSLIDRARRLPPLPDRPDPRLLLRLTGPEALPEPATEAAYPAEDGLRSGLEGLVLTIGDRRFPAAPVTTATSPAAAAPAIPVPSVPRPGETVESVPATSGSIPEGLLAVRDVRSTRTTIPAIATAPTGDVPSSSAPPSGSSSRSDVLVLRTDPAQATLERSPDVDAPAVGSRWTTSADERLRRRAGADAGPVESAIPGMGRLHSGLMLVAPSSYSPDSSDLHAPASGTATDWPGTDWPGTDPKLHESGTDLASGLSSITAGNEEWEHRLGPGPVQSANALLLTVSSDDAPSPPDDGSLWAPSSSDTAAYDSAADGATPEGARVVASAPGTGSRSATIEDQDGVLQSEPSPMLVVNVAILNDYSNYDPFSAATASYRPFRLGSAVPQSDYALWDPVWMPQGGGSDPRTLILAAARGHEDWLAQVADAAPPEPEPGDEWTVLLGTGQRLTLGVDAAAVAIASPEVADVQLLTPRVLFVMGRSLGRTTVSVLGEDGSVFERDVSVVLDLKPLRDLLAGEPGLEGVQVEGLARGVALAGDVGSQDEAERALGLVTTSLPEGILIENNLDVGVDLEPLQALLASEPGLGDIGVRQVGRGVALTGEVASAEAADRAHGLAVASLPEGLPVENNLRVAFDIEPLRTVLAAEPGLEDIRVRRLARGVALAGNVDSPEAADRALGLATASLPEGTLIESNLDIGLDLGPLRALLAGEPGLDGVEVRRVGRGFALTGEVAWAEAADRAHRLAVTSLPEAALVENNLRVAFDILPLRAALAGEPGTGRVQVQELARGVALAGEVDSPEMAERALRLATASLPEGLLVENNLTVGLGLEPLRALVPGESGPDDLSPLRVFIAGEAGLEGVRVQQIGRGMALTGEVASAEAADRAHRLVVAALPETVLVENNLRVSFDMEPLRAVLAAEQELAGIRVRRLPRGVELSGNVDSQESADRALRLAAGSLPEGTLVEHNLDVGLDLGPLRALLAGEPGLADVEIQRVGRGVVLTGEVASAEAAGRAHGLAAASLPESLPVENNLRVEFDIVPLRVLLAGEAGLERVQVQRLARGVALTGYVDSPAAADRAMGLASASLPEGLPVENNLTVGLGLEPLRAFLAGEAGLDDLSPLRAFIAGEPGLDGVEVLRVGRGVALTGEVASAEAADRAHRLAVAALPEGVPVENNLRVVFDIVPLRVLLAGEAGLARVQVQRLARGVALAGYVDSAAAEDRALRLAAASLPEGLVVENNLDVGLDLKPLRALLAGEPGLAGVEVRRVGRGVALTGAVASAEAADRAYRLAAASLPDSLPVENNLRVVFDVEPLRAVLAAEPGLEGVDVRQLARGVALAGEVASPEAADRAYRLAAASLPEGLVVENNLEVGLDLEPLRALMSGAAGLEGVEVLRVGRGVALTGEVASADAADRAHRLAVAFLPESLPVENNLRVQFDIEPLRTVLGAEPGLEGIRVQRLARGVALAGDIASPEAADRARRLAVASLPEGLLVENNLSVVLDLAPLHALMVGEPGLEDVEVRRVGQGVALTGEVESAEASDRAHRLAMASLPESLPVENNLRVVFDVGPLRAILAGEPELDRVQVQELGRGVVLTGEVASAEAFERAQRIATASLPEGVPVENSLRVVPDIEHLRAALAGEPGLDRVQVQRLARGVALSGDVDSPAAEDRALRLAAASLAEGVPVENNLNVGLDLAPLRSLVAGEPGLKDVRVERTGRGVALIGEVGSAEVADQAARLAAALLPEDMAVENNLRVVWDAEPLRALLAGSTELDRVQVQRLARGVVLSGEVASHAAADLAFRLASASVPEGVPVENTLDVRLDLSPLRVLIAGERDLRNVRVKRVGRGVALSGEVGSAEGSDRAHRLAVASLPEGVAVENGLRVAPDVGPLRVLLAGEPGLERVHVQKLARGVALAGDVASPKAADRALRLAAASLPEGMLVEDNLSVALDLAPLEALMAAEEDFEGIRLNRIGRGVALTGEVGSQTEAERAARLAAATLPESALVENNLRVVLDSGPLRAALAGDPEFDRVHVLDLEHGLSLNGEVSSAAAAARAHRLAAVSLPADTPVENNLRIAGPLQVNLEVQIAEVQRSIAEEFGFNWELFGRSAEGVLGGGFRIGRQLPLPGQVGRPGQIGAPQTVPPTVPAIQPSVVDGLTSPSLILSRTWEEIGITGMVDALAKAGLANVLARPNVTANSGETASFFSGGEFPLPSGFKDGVIVFEYKKYGVVLDFVPTIVDDGRVELTVRPEVSEPSQDNSVQVAGGVTVPVINVRRAETTVEMGDGESIVIAGLFSSASNEVQSGVPILKDLPLLGAMFGHTSTRADELELIVTVTARLVQAGPAPGEAVTAGSGQANNSYYY